MNLYTKYAKDFSNKRWTAWAGWNKLTPFLPNELEVLDLGCGNSRFAEFILEKNFVINKYFSLDSSLELLKISSEKLSSLDINFSLIYANLEKKWIHLLNNSRVNLAVIFGVMHHIQSFEKRKKTIESSFEMLEDGGIMICTFWQFEKFDDFLKKHQIKKLESSSDYILSFGNNKDTYRFAHSFTDSEIDDLVKNYNVISDYLADGVSGKMNRYVIIKK